MEPYRPVVDALVVRLVNEHGVPEELDMRHKGELLKIPVLDVLQEGRKSPLMAAVNRTTASLAKCFRGEQRRLTYASLP